MSQGTHLLAGDDQCGHVEEFQVRRRSAGRGRDELHGVRSLHLKAIRLAARRVSAANRALVQLHPYVVPARRRVELNPIQHRCASHEIELILFEIEQDHIADDMTVVIARYELLRLVDREIVKAIDAEVGEQFGRVGSFHQDIRHVVALVEQHAGLLPRALLVSPIGIFRRHSGVGVRTGLLIAQQIRRAANGFQNIFQAADAHDSSAH